MSFDKALDLEYPANVLKELGFEEIYLTPEQEERFEEIVEDASVEERDLFAKYYALHTSLYDIVESENKSAATICEAISATTRRLIDKKDFILGGKQGCHFQTTLFFSMFIELFIFSTVYSRSSRVVSIPSVSRREPLAYSSESFIALRT